MITDINQLNPSKTYTYADYLAWRFKERVELIHGHIRKMSPAPSDAHQKVSINLSTAFSIFLKKKKCQVRYAPYDVRLIIPSETPISSKRKKGATAVSDAEIQTVVQPDILVVCDPSKIDAKGCLGAPDLVVEILSEGNNRDDLVEKFAIYESAGVREYWIVHPHEQTITIYAPNERGKYAAAKPFVPGEMIHSAVLPGLEIAVGEVFE